MKIQTRLLVCSLLVLGGLWPVAASADQYGAASVEQGSMTIVRSGRSTAFRVSPAPVAVMDGDLVRLRDDSRVVLKTRDKANITLGSNAIFQVEPWQTPQKSGIFRMVFGRFRATITGLVGEERFNMKTATATIGVKGTENTGAVTSVGNTAVQGIENVTTNSGPDGVDQNVGPNMLSVTVGGQPATPAVSVTPEFKREMVSLAAPPAGSTQGNTLPAENSLVTTGVVTKENLDKSKQDKPTPPPAAPPTSSVAPVPTAVEDAQQAGSAVKGRLNLKFEK